MAKKLSQYRVITGEGKLIRLHSLLKLDIAKSQFSEKFHSMNFRFLIIPIFFTCINVVSHISLHSIDFTTKQFLIEHLLNR